MLSFLGGSRSRPPLSLEVTMSTLINVLTFVFVQIHRLPRYARNVVSYYRRSKAVVRRLWADTSYLA